MTDSTNHMLTALSNLEKSPSTLAAVKQCEKPEAEFNSAPDMASVLANCFVPDGREPLPKK